MRKILLSISVIAAFVFYIIYQRSGSQALTLNSEIPTPTPSASSFPTDTPIYTITPKPNPSASPPPSRTPTPTITPAPTKQPGLYKNGTYTGPVTDAFYGNVQIQVVIQNGRIADVVFLDYPQDRDRSVRINTQAMPYLKSEAIQAQNAAVDIVSGATQTSLAFRESLASALAQAKN